MMEKEEIQSVKDETTSLSEYEDQIEFLEEYPYSDESEKLTAGENEKQTQNKPKILVQRVFHQPEKHVVEQKLDYVVADSEVEISRHVFGGLFNARYYSYIPENYCKKKHPSDLFEFQDESLPKIGDKFDSLESFRLYIDGKAREWKYYLKCADSHRKNGSETFVYKCVFASPRMKVSKAKGIRKRTRKVPLHDCPCRVLVKPVPPGAKNLTVIYVCNHHDHPLTDEYFQKLQHGRRLHPSVKDELMDLLSLDVDRVVIKKYIESLTGYSMSTGFFANMLISMKKNKIERKFSVEKVKEISQKIKNVKEQLGLISKQRLDIDPDDDLLLPDTENNERTSQLAQVINVLNSVSTPKRPYTKRAARTAVQDSETCPKLSKVRKKKAKKGDSANLNSKSRLETRLQQLNQDEEVLQNVKHLQDSVMTENVTWKDGQNSVQYLVRSSSNIDEPSTSNIQNENEVFETVNKEDLNGEIIESMQSENNILYNSEITILEASADNSGLVLKNNIEGIACDTSDADNISYYIQYEDNNDSDVANQSYILLENLENLPVQVQATELATVDIIPEHLNGDLSVDPEQSVVNITETLNTNETTIPKETNNVEVIDEIGLNLPQVDVYEVLETDSKKILPSRDIVQSMNKSNSQNVGKNRKINKKRNSQYRKHSSDFDSSSDDANKNNKRAKSKLKSDIKKEIDFDESSEDEHYLIVVGSDDEAISKATFGVDSKNNLKDAYFSKMNIKTELPDNHSTNQEEQDKLVENIHNLRQYKIILENEIQALQQTKNRLQSELPKS